jgi:basic membrane protein A and related proteins
MKRKKFVPVTLLLAVAATGVALVAAGVGSAKHTATFKVAWILVGPHNDGGWSQSHYDGMQYVRRALGATVQTTYKENIVSNTQFSQTVSSLVAQGYKMIFSTSYGYVDKKFAAKYPNVLFEQATGTDQAKNLAEYFGAAEDTVFLSGMAAGAATKTGNIGYVVAYPIPEVIRHADAFALGAQLMHPGAKVHLVWTNSWYDLAKEKKAAESLVNAGADVLGQNVDSPATGQFAESKTLPWVGYDSNAQTFAPKSWLTAAVYDWGPYYVKRVKAAMNGTWKTGFYYGSIKDGFTALAPFGPRVTAATKAAIAAKMKAIENGTFYEFTGPITAQNGKVVVPAGKKLSVTQLYSVTWLVKGVIGSPTG